MDRLSYSTFSVARVLMALCVFFCHVFERFNDFGFLFVGVFFFMSGYGMEITQKRYLSLKRLIPFIFYFIWFSLIYLILFRVFEYPSSWFLVIYFCVMVIYRFIQNIYLLLVVFLFFALVLMGLGFNWGWMASYGGFLFGVFFARNRSAFTFKNCICLVPLCLMAPWTGSVACWVLLPIFSWIVLSVSSISFLKFLSYAGDYTFYFYCVHCAILGLFGATWTLGGSPSLLPCVGAFFVSVFVSFYLKESLFNYPKIQKAG
ncbi:hypothetical protein [Fibrobacter sp.]|uniref:hypothetical protein n=1 Tax=Fibrobacter sp. TaxID=35828 RepID=UPI0025C0E52C|nr:hypothetical protein [Fibrobacter sp.]MBR3073603.1 hypothetical protein [Fibrobacter sp.]